MPDKPLTVITYAASASLAAVALVYFFNPNYLIDGESSTISASTRKKGIVGLSNPANDCFINSILQSLAGLGDLRLYLIRELHRRKLDGPEVYASLPLKDKNGRRVDARKLESLQSGEVTQGLKDIIDGLNERPIYKKTISARMFIRVLEHAFDTRISRTQQDAQELLQIVAERLGEEYYAGADARRRARHNSMSQSMIPKGNSAGLGLLHENNHLNNYRASASTTSTNDGPSIVEDSDDLNEDEIGFPLEGKTEAQIECQHCHFVPKANPTTFVMLTLPVPQKASTTLNECFDVHFKREYIDDYKCDKCRLEHAIEEFSKSLIQANMEHQKASIRADIAKLRQAIQDDPEKVPEGVELPDMKHAPKRRIARHVQMTSFPKILVIHLSRSIFDPRSSSTKNAAKISFPESLPLGGILNRRNYKLLGMVTHKGTHHSGHYESFRRQHLYAPYSTPHKRKTSGPYSLSVTPDPSTVLSPSLAPESLGSPTASLATAELLSSSTMSPSNSLNSGSASSPSTRPSSESVSGAQAPKPRYTPTMRNQPPSSASAVASPLSGQGNHSRHASANPSKSSYAMDISRFKRKRNSNDRWWRISDDKIKECRTSDVLSMQKEVYMLFYEIEKDTGDDLFIGTS
ncbi:hypothetical protein MMC12_005118 [Toensbergia leucococca]|nr:hypothetical protein [Toensbergia leucococca]